MAKIYNFLANRTLHLLEGNFRQVEQVRKDWGEFEKNLSKIGNFLEEIAKTLKNADLQFQRHVQTCKMVLARNEECQQALERNEIEELTNFRNRLAETRSRCALRNEKFRGGYS